MVISRLLCDKLSIYLTEITVCRCPTEQDVFQALGLEWRDPSDGSGYDVDPVKGEAERYRRELEDITFSTGQSGSFVDR